MRILVVDDSRTMRSMLCSYARNQGIESEEACDGLDALDKLREAGPFDAALIDWDMPRMDGLSLVKEVRADPELDEMKVMMVTAQSSFSGVTEAIMAGADDYLMKPLNEEMFIEKLRLIGVLV